MPTAIQNVVNELAAPRQSAREKVESLVQTNFARLIVNDARLGEIRRWLFPLTSKSGSLFC